MNKNQLAIWNDSVLTDRQWQYESNYGGKDYRGYYVIYTKTRDSDLIEESNYPIILKSLTTIWDSLTSRKSYSERRLNDYPPIVDARFNHFLCGYYDAILVHRSAPIEILLKAIELIEAIENYSILDESDYSERELDQAEGYWNRHQRSDLYNHIWNLIDDSTLPDRDKKRLSDELTDNNLDLFIYWLQDNYDLYIRELEYDGYHLFLNDVTIEQFDEFISEEFSKKYIELREKDLLKHNG